MAKTVKTPQDVAKKWSRNLAGAGESIKQGVLSVTTAPTEKAARRADAYVEGTAKAAATGKWQRRLRSVTLQQWQDAVLSKGLQRVASGATAAVPKMEAFMGEWLPYMAQLQSKLEQTPRGDLEQNIQRMVETIRFNSEFQRRG